MDSSRIVKLSGAFVPALLFGPVLLPGPAWAQSLKLSGALAHELRSGSVTHYSFTSDGARIVYRADRAQNGVFELFSRPTDGSAPSIQLNGPLPPGGTVAGGGFDDDNAVGAGERVAFRADRTVQGIFELYSVPADGSTSPLRLSPALVHVAGLWLSPARDLVYYTAEQSLFRVPLDGSAAPIPIAAGFDTFRLHFSPDGSRLIFHSPTPQETNEFLYSVPADGSAAPVLLHESKPGNFEYTYFDHLRFASDGVHLLYDHIFPFESYTYADLFSVPLDGSQAPTQIDTGSLDHYAGNFGLDENSPLDRVAFLESGVVYSAAYDGTQRVALTPAGWTSDYDRVIVSGTDVLFGAHTATVTSVLRAPLDGSSVGVPLFPGLTTFGYVKQIEVVASTKVVFLGAAGFGGLYSVPLAGAPPLLLLNPPVISGRGAQSFQIHPDGQRVVFLASPFSASGGLVELFVAPLDDSVTPLKLNAPIVGNGDVASFLLSPDGTNVAYRANPTGNQTYGVFGAPLDGLGPVIQHNEPGPSDVVGGDVLDYVPSHDGKLVVYRADEDLDESFQLFAADTVGRGHPVPLTALLSASGDVLPGFALSPAGDRVVFQTAEGTLFKLFSAPTTPGAAPIELDTSTFAYPLPLVISPDGARVVYRERFGGTSNVDHALRSVLIDGSSPPVTLHALLPSGRQVIDFQVSPDGLSVVYRADKTRLGEYELFRSPLDGSTPTVRLHGPLVAGRWVWVYQISPDSARVAFRANLRVTARMDVYSVPIVGGTTPLKLNDAATPNGGVADFTISPDSKTVVYGALTIHPDSSSQLDLFSAPIQGHRALRRSSGEFRGGVVRLTQLPSGHSVQDFLVSADGTQVLYRANRGPTTIELFRASTDGSSPPVLLSSPLGLARSVTTYALSPDQSRVVYLADALANDVFEVFSEPLAGGPVVRLDPLPSFADVTSFRIDAHSERVVYLANGNTAGEFELFAVPIDGSAPAKRLNGPLPVGGDVASDFFLLPGGRTLYRSDQVTNDVLELFVSLAHTILPM